MTSGTEKQGAFEWWDNLSPTHKTLLQSAALGTGGALAGGAILGGLRARRPLDVNEEETKDQRRKAVIRQALLGALLGGAGGVAAGTVPQMLSDEPASLGSRVATAPVNAFGRNLFTTLLSAGVLKRQYGAVPGLNTIRNILANPALLADVSIKEPPSGLMSSLQAAERELGSMPAWRRGLESTGVPALGRRLKDLFVKAPRTSLSDLFVKAPRTSLSDADRAYRMLRSQSMAGAPAVGGLKSLLTRPKLQSPIRALATAVPTIALGSLATTQADTALTDAVKGLGLFE
jgi:hypothetical protein